MFEDYKKRQEELDNREKCAKKEYEIAQAYLFSYNDDLETLTAKFNADKEALRLKYDYYSKEELCNQAYKQLLDMQKANKDAKILFVLDAIYTLLDHPFYKRSEHGAWNFLWNEWQVQHDDYCYSFQQMYELIKEEGLEEVDVYAPSEYNYRDQYEIRAIKYFRGDTDECNVKFPKRIVDNLDEFINSIESKLTELDLEIKKNEEAQRQKRLEMYEQLKAEFGA
jgi:hypothetical protein